MSEKENEEEIERLASMLKKQGLAASFMDARKLAENIMTVRKREVKKEVSIPKEEKEGKPEKPEKLPGVDELKEIKEEIKPDTLRFDRADYDITKETKTLKELMAEDAEKVYKEEQKQLEEVYEAKDKVVDKVIEEKKEEVKEEEEEKEEPSEEKEEEKKEEVKEVAEEKEEIEEKSEEEKVFDNIDTI